MGRPERPLNPDDGPVQRFAHDLRELRKSAGLTLEEMAPLAHYSVATLSQVTRGHTLPSVARVQAYVRACGGDVEAWTARLKELMAEPKATSPEQEASEEEPVSPPEAEEHARRNWWTYGVVALAGVVAGVLVATGVAWVWPWTIFQPTPDLQAEVGTPKAVEGGGGGGCAWRSTDVRDRRDDTAGTIWYRDCGDYIETWLTDHMKDGRCVWATFYWGNGATDTTSRACPAGDMQYNKIVKLTAGYRVTLEARNTG
ncbi:helix-turn-helix domain-containing protein [Lentzea sp. NPDC054927]